MNRWQDIQVKPKRFDKELNLQTAGIYLGIWTNIAESRSESVFMIDIHRLS